MTNTVMKTSINMIAADNRKNGFFKNTKMGTIPVTVGAVRVKEVKTAKNKFGSVSEPERPIIGTKVSKNQTFATLIDFQCLHHTIFGLILICSTHLNILPQDKVRVPKETLLRPPNRIRVAICILRTQEKYL